METPLNSCENCEYKQKEIDELKDQIDHQDSLIFELDQNVQVFMEKTKSLQAENAKLRKCVEFYSNTDNWLEEKDRNNLYTIIKEDASDDYCDYLRFGGKRARQVLKELEEK